MRSPLMASSIGISRCRAAGYAAQLETEALLIAQPLQMREIVNEARIMQDAYLLSASLFCRYRGRRACHNFFRSPMAMAFMVKSRRFKSASSVDGVISGKAPGRHRFPSAP